MLSPGSTPNAIILPVWPSGGSKGWLTNPVCVTYLAGLRLSSYLLGISTPASSPFQLGASSRPGHSICNLTFCLCLGKQWKMAEIAGFLHPLWKTQKRVLDPGFRWDQLLPLETFGEWIADARPLSTYLPTAFQIKMSKSEEHSGFWILAGLTTSVRGI